MNELWRVTPQSEAPTKLLWLGETLGAEMLVVAGAPLPEGAGLAVRPVARPSDLQDLE